VERPHDVGGDQVVLPAGAGHRENLAVEVLAPGLGRPFEGQIIVGAEASLRLGSHWAYPTRSGLTPRELGLERDTLTSSTNRACRQRWPLASSAQASDPASPIMGTS
jgi:hypothetical protein